MLMATKVTLHLKIIFSDRTFLSNLTKSRCSRGMSSLIEVDSEVDSGKKSELTSESTALSDDKLLKLLSVDVEAFL